MPALFFLLALTVLRLKGLIGASLTVLISVAVSSLVFGIPKASIVGAALLGIANGIFPIGFIVLMALHALVRIDSRVA